MAVEGTFIAEQKGAACRGRGRPPRPEDNVEKEWKGMEKLTEQNRAEVEAYISAEPEYNVFVQGDLENYGFESKTVEIFGTRAADGALCALLLRYFNNYCLCMSGVSASPRGAVSFGQGSRCGRFGRTHARLEAARNESGAHGPPGRRRGTAGGLFSADARAAGCAGSDRAGSTDR